MTVLRGFAWILLAQLLGESLARTTGVPVPGPILGMVIMALALNLPLVRSSVGPAADTLLAHLSLLFVPVGVGVIVHLELLSQNGFKIAAVLVVATWLGLATTAMTLNLLSRREG